MHSNSGVPNHGYALLMDGGTYNGVTVPKFGMTEAAHIYWRAQSEYQTEASPVPADGPITAADCAAVGAMAQAVELRKEPTQSNFPPLLVKNAPSLCDKKSSSARSCGRTTSRTGWDNWSKTNEGVYPGWPGRNWVKRSILPGNRSGQW